MKQSNKQVVGIAYPIFLTLLAQNLINVIGTAFLGRVSEVALGASAIAGVLYLAIYMLGFGFSQGAQIIIGRRNGEQHYDRIGSVFNSSLAFNFLFAILVFVLAKFFVPVFLKFMVSSENVYHAAVEFLDWRIYGFFFSFLNVIFRAFYVGITQTKVLTISAIITCITNVILDYLLIFGNFGFPEMGIAGAGIAAVAAEAATFLYLLAHTIFKIDSSKFQLFKRNTLKLKTTKHILNISVFTMMQYFISVGTWFLFFIFIEHLGERSLAITNIARSLYVLLMIPANALATTANTMVSNMIGAGQKEDVMRFVNRMVRLALLLVTPILLLTFVFPELAARVYTDNPELASACVNCLRIVSVAILICTAGNIIFSSVSGTGNTRTALLIEAITLVFYMVYIYVTARIMHTPVEIVWLSEYIYWGLIAICAYIYLLSGKWKLKVI